MDKQKEKKKKVLMPFGLRNKLIAAISMLLVSSIMMVSSTYAWFTLSTAPEVKNISTTVAGNGSLEIALMPSDGMLGSIRNGRSTDGTVALTTANTSWGNLIDLSDESYGLNGINLNPASRKMKENSDELLANNAKPLSIANYGMDGRITTLDNSKIFVTGMNTESKKFASGVENPYGVRAIGEVGVDQNLGSSYGYVIDLALRLNTSNENGEAGKLLLLTDPAQRVYGDSTNADTLGSGSSMSFSVPVDAGLKAGALKELLGAIRITFVQNYGNAGVTEDAKIKVLGTAKLDTSELYDYTNGKNVADAKTTEGSDEWVVTTEGTAPIYLYKTVTSEDGTAQEVKLNGTTEDLKAVLLTEMPKNAAQQISAIVWLDGTAVKNANVSATAAQSLTGTLNLQFSTDIKLNPAVNTPLKGE